MDAEELQGKSLKDLQKLAADRADTAESLGKDKDSIITKVLGDKEIGRIQALNKAVSSGQRADQKAIEAEADLIEEGQGAPGGSSLDRGAGGGGSSGGVPMILKLDAAETRRLFESGQANANASFASRVTGRPAQGRRKR